MKASCIHRWMGYSISRFVKMTPFYFLFLFLFIYFFSVSPDLYGASFCVCCLFVSSSYTSLFSIQGLTVVRPPIEISTTHTHTTCWNNTNLCRLIKLLHVFIVSFFFFRKSLFLLVGNLMCLQFKGREHCFSMQVVINKCVLLNPELNFGSNPSCHFQEKCKKRTFNSEK